MVEEASVLFPNQLFKDNPCTFKETPVYIIEDSLYFGDMQYPAYFHKKKLIFHRASMKYYADFLQDLGYLVIYLDYQDDLSENKPDRSIDRLFETLIDNNVKKIYIIDPVDWALEKRLNKQSTKFKIKLQICDNPAFLNSRNDVIAYNKIHKKYQQTSFYIEQRKKYDLLIQNGKPRGGKWTFDKENRKSLSRDIKLPNRPKNITIPYLKEAENYITKKFPKNPGSTTDFFYPITHESAEQWLNNFLEEKLTNFGPYEDAVSVDNHILFHSVLSPLLNVGLLIPDYVLKQVVNHADGAKIPLNSLEGFIRQIIGWREFMRIIYEREGVNQRNSNYWNNTHPIPRSFYNGTTGILPIDNLIKSLLKTGYLHHIERLMFLGNFMNLCEIKPDDVYRWFMEMFIDAFDWVMVPNVYGMSLHADGGLITTKPYISSSNYIRKMSDYPKGAWCEIWDALYWRFINKHSEKIKANPRISMMVNLLNKKSKETINQLLETADNFLKTLHKIN